MLPHSYPKSLAVGHRLLGSLFEGEYIVEEKVDGSQFSFGMFEGVLHMRSKGAQLFPETDNKLFNAAVAYVHSIQERLTPGYTYRGEVLYRPKHNTLAYKRVPDWNTILFDIEDAEGNPMEYRDKVAQGKLLGLETVPMLASAIDNIDDLHRLLETESILGGVNIEGVVIKNYGQIGPDKKYMVAKYVSEAFKEKHRTAWKKSNPTRQDIITDVVDSLKYPAECPNRWLKALQHLEECSAYCKSPKDIGALIQLVHKDIEEEEQEYIKDRLYQFFIKEIKRRVSGGLAEWYKEYLMKEALDNNKEDIDEPNK